LRNAWVICQACQRFNALRPSLIDGLESLEQEHSAAGHSLNGCDWNTP
jgi:hypothetical protein